MSNKTFIQHFVSSSPLASTVAAAIAIGTVGCGDNGTPEVEPHSAVQSAALSPPSLIEVPSFETVVEPVAMEEESASESETSVDSVPSYFIRVRPGENLIDLARWSASSPTELAASNGMLVQDTLYAGQKLGLPLASDAEMDAFEVQRETAQQDRLDSYLSSRGGLETVVSHAMRQGESAWGVAQEKGEYPIWVVQAFNDGMDLSRLAIGDTITLPVTTDRLEATADFEEGLDAEALGVTESEGCSL